MVGESTTFGWVDDVGHRTRRIKPSWTSPVHVLRSLLKLVPGRQCAWARARVVDLSFPASTTRDWLLQTDARPIWCALFGEHPPLNQLFSTACARNVPIVEAARGVLAQADLYLFMMGINDGPFSIPVTETVDNIQTIRATLTATGGTSLLAPPLPCAVPSRHRDDVRNEEITRGLITGPDWDNPATDFVLYDQIHPTGAGYAVIAARWLDVLCPEADR